MTARTIMIQGTGSDVGKSVVTSAFCRILAQAGYRVAPFKSQNMALNSFITSSGGEIGRAQAVQAEAAMAEATVDMNPVLLKPGADDNSQVIFAGKARKHMTAREYFASREQVMPVIRKSLHRLLNSFEVVVLEGAGSPAEINLREKDMVNMTIARMIKAPVILTASIDKGGVFADIVGTLELLNQEERDLVKGIIINKFRGDLSRFKSGIDFIEEYTGLPVLGVIPYLEEMKLPEEDSLIAYNFGSEDYELDIAIVILPHISNFTDFDFLAFEPATRLRYVKRVEELGSPDLIIIPGSKNTIEDLEYLVQTGMVKKIKELHRAGTSVVGICGGYQMLGKKIKDPAGIETERKQIKGIGLLNSETWMEPEKVTSQVRAKALGNFSFFQENNTDNLTGYEIHQGRTEIGPGLSPLFNIERLESGEKRVDGAISEDGRVWGTYLHGLFDNDSFRRSLINFLREKKGLEPLAASSISAREDREQGFNEFADLVRNSLDMKKVYDIIFA